jgi:hypothetical protein
MPRKDSLVSRQSAVSVCDLNPTRNHLLSNERNVLRSKAIGPHPSTGKPPLDDHPSKEQIQGTAANPHSGPTHLNAAQDLTLQ